MPSLHAALVAALPEEAAGLATDADALDRGLRVAIATARAEWPELDVPDEGFVRHVAARLSADGPLLDALVALAASDLYLACACALDVPRAAALFVERRLGPAVDGAVRRIGGGERVRDEALQALSQQLLVERADGTRGIDRYGGRGALHAWLRVTATREVLRLVRGASKEGAASDDALLQALTADHDPELTIVAETYRPHVRDALHDAMTRLSERDRALLAYQAVDGLPIERIGALYNVHRSTASRWLAEAREMLLTETRSALQERLGASGSEVDSILRLVQSGLELSLERVLCD